MSRERDPAWSRWAEGALLVATAVLSLWRAGVAVAHARSTGRTWIGTDGPYLGDQMQYLGWISDASEDLRIGNPFRLEDVADRFVHPGLAISGVLHRLGLSSTAAYLLWKPVAVIVLFLAVRAFVHRHLEAPGPRVVALGLALLALVPMPQVYDWLDVGEPSDGLFFRALALDMWPGLYLWGYPFTAIAVALIPVALLAYEAARRDRRTGWAPAAGLLCAWLQPWQGATILAVVLGTELWLRRKEPGDPAGPWLATSVATALPLAYYAVLSRVDAGWELAGEVNRSGGWAVGTVTVFFLPIALLAALGLRGHRASGFAEVALRLWPLAALACFWTIDVTPFGTFPLHSIQGLSIPVAVLAVRAIATATPDRRRVLAAAGLGALVVAGALPLADELRESRASLVADDLRVFTTDPVFLEDGEVDALDLLRDADRPGGVLSRVYLGQVAPGLTGRRTWVGIASWTPDHQHRIEQADALFRGDLDPEAARALVEGSGAAFLLDDCQAETDLEALLGDLIVDRHRFGCAAVYELRTPTPA